MYGSSPQSSNAELLSDCVQTFKDGASILEAFQICREAMETAEMLQKDSGL